MNYKNFLIVLITLSVLFIGCNEEKKLSEQELEKKAEEYFYSLPDDYIIGFEMKTSNFVFTSSKNYFAGENKNWSRLCDHCTILKGKCDMSVEECKSYYGAVYVYNFEPKEGVMPYGRSAYGKVVLTSDGEPIVYYWTGFEEFV